MVLCSTRKDKIKSGDSVISVLVWLFHPNWKETGDIRFWQTIKLNFVFIVWNLYSTELERYFKIAFT